MKIIEVIADAGHHDTVRGIAERQGVTDLWFGPENEDGRQPVRLLVGADKRQAVLDALQTVLDSRQSLCFSSAVQNPVNGWRSARPVNRCLAT